MSKSNLLLSAIIWTFIFLMVNPLFSQSKTDKDNKEKVGFEILPEEMKVTINKKYKKFKVNKLFRTTKNEVRFIAELQKKNRLIYLHYDEKGNFVRKEKTKIFSFEESLEPRENNSNPNSTPVPGQNQPFPSF